MPNWQLLANPVVLGLGWLAIAVHGLVIFWRAYRDWRRKDPRRAFTAAQMRRAILVRLIGYPAFALGLAYAFLGFWELMQSLAVAVTIWVLSGLCVAGFAFPHLKEGDPLWGRPLAYTYTWAVIGLPTVVLTLIVEALATFIDWVINNYRWHRLWSSHDRRRRWIIDGFFDRWFPETPAN